jgi:hypothetical protein
MVKYFRIALTTALLGAFAVPAFAQSPAPVAAPGEMAPATPDAAKPAADKPAVKAAHAQKRHAARKHNRVVTKHETAPAKAVPPAA